MANFQNRLISPIFDVFRAVFSTNKSNVPIEWFLASFWHFIFLTQTEYFAKATTFAWAIAFARLPNPKIVSFLQYFAFFRAVFCKEQLRCCFTMVFGKFLAFYFYPNPAFCKAYSPCKMADFKNRLISPIFGVFSSGFLHTTTLMFL